MPLRTMASTGALVMSSPSSTMRPDAGRIRPETLRSREVLPAPLAPSTAVILPAGTEMLTASSALTGP
jgi:hypothetical protein